MSVCVCICECVCECVCVCVCECAHVCCESERAFVWQDDTSESAGGSIRNPLINYSECEAANRALPGAPMWHHLMFPLIMCLYCLFARLLKSMRSASPPSVWMIHEYFRGVMIFHNLS